MRQKFVQLNLRIPLAVKARLRKLARKSRRTMTGKLVEMIEREPTE